MLAHAHGISDRKSQQEADEHRTNADGEGVEDLLADIDTAKEHFKVLPRNLCGQVQKTTGGEVLAALE